MRKIILAILLIFSEYSFAQVEQVGWIAKFGIAGGVTPTWIMPNVDPLNLELKNLGLPELSQSGTFAIGGSGYLYILLVPNLRIGVAGFSGTSESEAVIGGLNRSAQYNYSIGALTIEYTVSSIKNFALSFGAMIGAGDLDVKVYQTPNSASWSGVWNDFNSPNRITNRTMKNSFFTLAPTVNVDIPLNRFIALRLGGGYILSFGGDWEVDNGIKLNGVPDELNGNSIFVQSGLFIGFFAF